MQIATRQSTVRPQHLNKLTDYEQLTKAHNTDSDHDSIADHFSDLIYQSAIKLNQMKSPNCISTFAFHNHDFEKARSQIATQFWKATAMLNLGYTTTFAAINIMGRIVLHKECVRLLLDPLPGASPAPTDWLWIAGYLAFRIAVKMEERPEISYRILDPKSGTLYRLFPPMRLYLSDSNMRKNMLYLEQQTTQALDHHLDMAVLPEVLKALHSMFEIQNRLPSSKPSRPCFRSLLSYLSFLSTQCNFSNKVSESEGVMRVYTKHTAAAVLNLSIRIHNQACKTSYNSWCDAFASIFDVSQPSEVQYMLRALTYMLRDPGPTVKKLAESINANGNMFGDWPTLSWN